MTDTKALLLDALERVMSARFRTEQGSEQWCELARICVSIRAHLLIELREENDSDREALQSAESFMIQQGCRTERDE